MGEIINLRLARKAKTRSLAEKTAEQNRLKFGRTKSDRTIELNRAEREALALDGHRLSPKKPDE